MDQHRLGKIIPPMTATEFADLKADIGAHGQHDPITIYQNQILDGWHRLRACTELGIPSVTETFQGNADEALAFVISRNLKRRHLSQAQRTTIAAEIATMQRGGQHGNVNASKTNRPIGPSVETGISEEQAAKLMNVSVRSVKRAKALLREASADVIDQVRSGRRSVSGALKDLRQKQPKPDPTLVGLQAYDRLEAELQRAPKDHELRKAGVSPVIAAKVLATRLQESKQKALELSASQQVKLDAYRRKLEREIEMRVHALTQERVRQTLEDFWLPHEKKMLDDAAKVLKLRSGIFSAGEYKKIVFCLHPDGSPSDAQKGEAFALIHERKVLLMAEKELPRIVRGEPLPKTMADLLARKRAGRRR